MTLTGSQRPDGRRYPGRLFRLEQRERPPSSTGVEDGNGDGTVEVCVEVGKYRAKSTLQCDVAEILGET